MSFTKLDYCQYLLSSQINYTLTNMAEHLGSWSHDTINRYLKGEKLTPRLLFEQVEPLLEPDPKACLIFDWHGPRQELRTEDRGDPQAVEWQREERNPGHRRGLVRLRQPRNQAVLGDRLSYLRSGERDGLSKLDHVRDMLRLVAHRGVPFETVLMDAWYATKELMLLIEGMGKKYYCPLKSNRQVDDSGGEHPYRRIDALEWSERELERGKLIKVKGFPEEHKVKLFRVVVHPRRTEWIVTNDSTRDSVHEARKARGLRWKIEEFHREAEQL